MDFVADLIHPGGRARTALIQLLPSLVFSSPYAPQKFDKPLSPTELIGSGAKIENGPTECSELSEQYA